MLVNLCRVSGVSGGEFAFEGVTDHKIVAGDADAESRQQSYGFRYYQGKDGHEAGLQAHVD